MSDFFQQSLQQPLAERLRPTILSDVVGQSHLLGDGGPIRLMYDMAKVHSMILWGPPGVGKTTIARLLAAKSQAHLISFSAIFSGVKEIREAVIEAQFALNKGKSTVIFVDEVHRFNKAQQDAFLPHVESGLFKFIGATTENPSFEINQALLSRSTIYTFKPLTDKALEQLIQRIMGLPEYTNLQLDEEIIPSLAALADQDARKLINTMERLLLAALQKRITVLDSQFIDKMMGEKLRGFDKGGDQFYEQISALHKSVRGSHPDAALYWLCRMLDSGADPRYLARRIIRMAWEDIGLADPRAMEISQQAALTYERLGSPEGELALAEAVLFLASAAKSNAAYQAYNEAKSFVKRSSSTSVPIHLRNAPTQMMKNIAYGKDYRYAHNESDGYIAGESYMPDGILEPTWYRPVERGLEIKIKEKLAYLKELDRRARQKK